jgi:5-methylcytosine-specific restriction endonuclease McrA
MKSKQAKACDISKTVKNAVWERDGEQCIICGNSEAMPNAHYIPRSHGGLGIEQNIVTLCAECHRAYDQSISRPWYKNRIQEYLKSIYPDWQGSNLTYQKY